MVGVVALFIVGLIGRSCHHASKMPPKTCICAMLAGVCGLFVAYADAKSCYDVSMQNVALVSVETPCHFTIM